MSGSFRVLKQDDLQSAGPIPSSARPEDRAHDHVVFHMSSGAAVIFNDPRRFGYMKIIARNAIEDEPLLKGLGPEPLGNEFDAAMLARSCANKKTSLKAALLDQRVVAGLGNIYVCEALFRAHAVAAKIGRDARHQKGRADRSRRAAGRRHPRGAEPGDQGRRLVAARPSPDLAANSAISSIRSRSMTAKARNARPRVAAASSGVSPRTDVRPSGARNARSDIPQAPRCERRNHHAVIPGRCESIEPGISRFRVRARAPRNDEEGALGRLGPGGGAGSDRVYCLTQITRTTEAFGSDDPLAARTPLVLRKSRTVSAGTRTA